MEKGRGEIALALRRFGAVTAAAVTLCAGMASAQSDSSDAAFLVTVDGCKFTNPAPDKPAPREVTWSGECLNGFVSGSGEVRAKSHFDVVYRGDFENGSIKQGSLEFAGFTYRGQFENNVPSGEGELAGIGRFSIKGAFEKGKPVGNVEFTFPTGERYVGAINPNTFAAEGQGTLYYLDGTVYEGMMRDNQPNGPGVKTFATGEVRRGFFVDGRAEGKVSIDWGGGTRYDGDFKAGAPHGRGIYKYATGAVYEGEFVAGDPQGKGKLVWSIGDVYEGDLVSGEPHGRGRIKFARGGAYEGEFVTGKRHGYGRRTSDDGMVKEGEWKNDELNGKCRHSYPDGETYDGYCVNDLYEGQGHLERTFTQEVYDGGFRQGVYHGKGSLRIGEYTYDGEFKHNQKDGHGKERRPDGTVYEGAFVQGHWHGRGVLKAKSPDGDNILYDGEFARGQFNGEGTLTIGAMRLQGEFKGDVLTKGTITASEGRVFEINTDAGTILEVLPDGSKKGVDDLPEELDI